VKRFVGCLVALAVASHASLLAEPRYAQTPPPKHILLSAAAKIKKVEPNWRFIPGVCNFRGPLLSEQVGVECGVWALGGQLAADTAITVSLHIVSSADAASHWIGREARLADGWTIADYDLADGARIEMYLDGRQFTIEVRRGRLLMLVGARTKSDAERFAKYLVEAISDEK